MYLKSKHVENSVMKENKEWNGTYGTKRGILKGL